MFKPTADTMHENSFTLCSAICENSLGYGAYSSNRLRVTYSPTSGSASCLSSSHHKISSTNSSLSDGSVKLAFISSTAESGTNFPATTYKLSYMHSRVRHKLSCNNIQVIIHAQQSPAQTFLQQHTSYQTYTVESGTNFPATTYKLSYIRSRVRHKLSCNNIQAIIHAQQSPAQTFLQQHTSYHTYTVESGTNFPAVIHVQKYKGYMGTAQALYLSRSISPTFLLVLMII